MKVSLQEIRERTYKPVDAWWTVLLVDPLASRLVRLVAPYRWITPNALTLLASILGFGAAACFTGGGRGDLVAGGILFHLSFVVDCMDGKIARLNGTGTVFGQWLDFVLDRVRVFVIALALFGGQYARGGDVTYLWLMGAAIFLDLFRYLNGSQMAKVRRGMRDQLNGHLRPAAGPAAETRAPEHPRAAGGSLRSRAGALLRRNRIRTHLISGIEYEMAVFIIGPVTGLILPVTIVAGAGLLVFETLLIYQLFRACQRFPGRLAAARAASGQPEAERVPAVA